jgi:hypothetical protein
MFVEIKKNKKPLIVNIEKIESLEPITEDTWKLQCEHNSHEIDKSQVKIIKQKMGLLANNTAQIDQYNQLIATLGTKGPRIQKA